MVLILRGVIVAAAGLATNYSGQALLLVNPQLVVIDPGLASIFVAVIAGAFMLVGQMLIDRRSHREDVRELEERLAQLERRDGPDRRRGRAEAGDKK